MKYFTPKEFRGWYIYLSESFKLKLDAFREELGYPVHISPASGAIGRHAGKHTSRHNVDRYGVLEALDVMPEVIEPERWIAAAKKVGLTGIGFYPDWKPQPGIHIDDRGGRLATWGGVRNTPKSRQRYVSLRHALNKYKANQDD